MTTATAAIGTTAARELALIERAQSGDSAAYSLLIDPRIDGLFRTAWAILRDEADARDATQETCIGAWQELGKLREPDRFDAWLQRSLVNRCRSRLRGRRRSSVREIHVNEGLEPRQAPVGAVDGLGDRVVGADAIRRAFARLSVDQRTILVLHHVEARSVRDIATVVGAPDGTIKWRLSEARRALQRALAREQR